MNGGRKREQVSGRYRGDQHSTPLLAVLLASGCLDTFGYSDAGKDLSTSDTATTSGAPDTASPSDTTAYPTTSIADTSAMTSATEILSDPGTTIDSDANSTSTTKPADTSGSTGDSQGFFFADDDFAAYVQIDRHGAVEAGTAGIRASGGLGLNGEDIAIRDAYNASNPTEDADVIWFGEIAESIMFFHDNLDMEIIDLGLTPATYDETVAQVGPVIIPDTIKYDPDLPGGYPNGRKLTDPVVDITLAALLLDLTVHPLDTFVGLLNPHLNDAPFAAEFPYLAPPHIP